MDEQAVREHAQALPGVAGDDLERFGFIFPQITGLGQSAMSERFAIQCIDMLLRRPAESHARH